MDKKFDNLLEELKEIKDKQIETLRKEKERYDKLYDEDFLMSEFLDVLNDILSYKDKILSLSKVIRSGGDFRLDSINLEVNINKNWVFTAYLCNDSKLNQLEFGVCDKRGRYLFYCYYYLKEGCEDRDEIYIDDKWFARIKDDKAIDLNSGIITSSIDLSSRVRDFVFDIKSVNFDDFLNKAVEELIEKQKTALGRQWVI